MREDAAPHDPDRWDAPGNADSRPRGSTPAEAAVPVAQPPAEAEHALERFAPAAALAVVAALVLSGLSAFGIWDPWEIEVAEQARRLVEGDAKNVLVGPWLVAQGFRLFGVDEWSGRLPIALCGVIAAALAYPLVARFAGRRAGAYAVLIAGTSPLFLFNARTMLGEAPVFALQAAIALGAMLALFGTRKIERGVGLVLALGIAAVAVPARGALLGALPPLGAVALVGAFEGKLLARRSDPLGFASALALLGAALGLGLAVAHAVVADDAGFSMLLGGAPQGGQPPGYDVVIERAFHAFAPWSALLPLALARLVAPSATDAPEDAERPLRTLCILWVGLSYAGMTLFLSRYGDKAGAFPVVALAAAVALLLRDVERARATHWPAAIAAGLIALLLLRDYALYPNGPVHGMPLSDFTVPEVFNPKGSWAACLCAFAGVVTLAFGAYAGDTQRGSLLAELAAPYRLLAAQWRRDLSFKAWLVLFALALLALEVFGVVALVGPKGMSTQAIKVGKALALVPPALPLALAGAQALMHGYTWLRELRILPVLAAGVAVGAYAAFGFMPGLSAHFSPREVYETYNDLAVHGEALVEYKVGTRSARYYAKGKSLEVDTLTELMDALLANQRTWAIFPADDLAPVDRMFRAKTGRHLFVADARSAKMTLASNQPVAGRRDQSFLAEFVKRQPPAKIQNRVDANFEDKVLLLGYDLSLPHGDHVAAGESFDITWYFKALRPIPGTYRVFVHIDAGELRIHGDHDPLDGRYPVRLWDEGDIIVDRQRIEVPPNYTSGAYTIFIGFYAGETRLVVKEGAHDDANRVRAGVLRIR